MRIVAGSAKGVRLAPVPPGVRPLSDRAREGLFSSLGSAVAGAHVLDLYAGTGATGIEALSRGAERAIFIDRNRAAIAAVRDNLARAQVAQEATTVVADVAVFLAASQRPGAPVDLVFCDPPYADEAAGLTVVLQQLSDGWLASGAWTVVLSRSTKSSMPVIPIHWRAARELRYGDSLLTVLRPGNLPKDVPGDLEV